MLRTVLMLLVSSSFLHSQIVGAKIVTEGRAASRPGRSSNTWECEHVTGVPDDVRQSMKLGTFYQKYLHANGIPILSSNQALDSSLRRACYVVTFLMADRQDIRDYFYSRNGRAAVIAYVKDEHVITISEHSWLEPKEYWKKRARGLGGTIQNPISTCGEESLLCYSNVHDPWFREGIFLHEFVHSIHEVAVAFNGAIPDFDRRINKRYNYLKRTGERWANTYAMSTDREYLAEGAQSYFDVDSDVDPPNGIHNFVNTRDELKAYYPIMFGYCQEIFPCGNRIVDRCDDAKQQNIAAKRWHFRMNCNSDGSGGVWMDFKSKRPVDPSVPHTPFPPAKPVTQRPTEAPGGCTDDNHSCEYWASIGECSENPDYMTVNCKRSCKICGGGGGGVAVACEDLDDNCAGRAGNGHCDSNNYVQQNCKKSCNRCTS